MQRRTGIACALVLILLLPIIGSAAAPEVQPPLSADPVAASEFIIGNTVFVLAHEFGHAIIRDFNVPILGLEENSADTLAAGNPELIYWAQHDLSARRAARILCLLVGSDEARYGWLVGTGLVPEVRARVELQQP